MLILPCVDSEVEKLAVDDKQLSVEVEVPLRIGGGDDSLDLRAGEDSRDCMALVRGDLTALERSDFELEPGDNRGESNDMACAICAGPEFAKTLHPIIKCQPFVAMLLPPRAATVTLPSSLCHLHSAIFIGTSLSLNFGGLVARCDSPLAALVKF